MRLYGKKILRKFADKRANRRTETRDAVLWYVDRDNNTCRVKIQGSSEYVIAHFPRNWKKTPYWLKVGNAVRILHRSGVRGYVEVIGEGRAIPLPVEGSALPDPPTLPDMILSGLELLPTAPESWAVLITSGVYRIGGELYYFTAEIIGGAIIMNDPAPMTMGASIVMLGRTQYVAELDPAPAAGYFRYDAFCIGVEGEIVYLKGTASKTNPVKPTIPSGHLQIGNYIFVQGADTEVESTDIGAEWAPQLPTSIDVSYSEEFEWDGGDNTPEMNISCTVKDQYGFTLTTSSGGFTLVLEKIAGIGQLWSVQSGYDSDEVQNTTSASYTFKYQRDQAGEESSPVILEATLVGHSGCKGFAGIILLDSGGDPI